jgi:hypothetical protein
MPLEIANTSADPRDAMVLQYVQSSGTYTRLSADILTNNVTQITLVEWSTFLIMRPTTPSHIPGRAWTDGEGNYFVTVNHSIRYPDGNGTYIPTESMLFHELSHYALNHVQGGGMLGPIGENQAVNYTNQYFHTPLSLRHRVVYEVNRGSIRDGAVYLSKPKCFVAGTPVTMADGSGKPIEQLIVGDFVHAFAERDNRTAGTLHPARVTRILHGVTTEWIVLGDGTRVTPGHNYLRPDGSFKAISDILARDGLVVDAAGHPKHVSGHRYGS